MEKDDLRAGIMPAIFIYYEGIYFIFEGNRKSVNEILNFINKLIHPVI